MLYDFHQKSVFLIDVAIPGDSRLNAKVNEKMKRHTDHKIELQRMWKFYAVIVLLIIGCLGSVSKYFVKNLKSLNIFYGILVAKLLKSLLLNSCHIYNEL